MFLANVSYLLMVLAVLVHVAEVRAAPIGVAGGSFPIAADARDGSEKDIIDALIQGHYELEKFNRMHHSNIDKIHHHSHSEEVRGSHHRPTLSPRLHKTPFQ